MSQCNLTPADRLFRRRCQIAAAVAFLVYLATAQAALHLHHSILGTVFAAISGAAIFAEFVAVALLAVRIRDEFQRILLTKSVLWASAFTAALATIWGSVELHEHGNVPHIPYLAIPFLLVLLTTIAKLIIFRQHKSPAE